MGVDGNWVDGSGGEILELSACRRRRREMKWWELLTLFVWDYVSKGMEGKGKNIKLNDLMDNLFSLIWS